MYIKRYLSTVTCSSHHYFLADVKIVTQMFGIDTIQFYLAVTTGIKKGCFVREKKGGMLYTESLQILVSLDSQFNGILTLPVQLTQYNWPSVMLNFHRRTLNAINRLSCYINCSEAVQTTCGLLAKRKSRPS